MNKRSVKKAAFAVLKMFSNMGGELTLPVPIKKIAKSFPNIRVVPYSKYMNVANLTKEEMYRQAGTEDAYTDYDAKNDRYIICYNDLSPTIMSSNRYRWNIAHELGHIVLKHHSNKKTRLFRNTLTKGEYNTLEKEADWFAAYILVPYVIIQKLCPVVTAREIQKKCRISNSAATYRKEDYDKWERMNPIPDTYDQLLLHLFYHYTICKQCKLLINDNWKYCPICCKSNFVTSYSKNDVKGYNIMIYKNFESKDGVLTKCVTCGNEEIVKEAEYCHICGSPLKNKCYSQNRNNIVVQCAKAEQYPIPVNARFCPYCASESLFLSRGMVKLWNAENGEEELYDENVPF